MLGIHYAGWMDRELIHADKYVVWLERRQMPYAVLMTGQRFIHKIGALTCD